MLERADLFDAELVEKLSGGLIAGPPSVFPQRGAHLSQRRGASLEFSEHTEYAPGDDLKNLDWKVLGKTDRYYVRRFEDERLNRTVFVLDASASMSYGGGEATLRGSKYHLAARVIVAAAACLLRQGDAVGLALTGEARNYLSPRGGERHLEAMIEVLGNTTPGGHAALAGALAEAAERVGRASSIVAVSDFLDEADEDLSVFSLLRARSVMPKLVQVLHPDEVELPFDQTLRFLDLEGPASLVADPDALRKAYGEEMTAFVEGLRKRAEAAGIPYALVRSADEAGKRLGRVLRRGGGR